MKLAFSQGTEDISSLLGEFRAAGYEGLQLKGNQYLPFLNSPQEFLDQWGMYDGVASALIAGWAPGDMLENLRKAFAFGESVGTEMIVFCHCVAREGLSKTDIRRFAKSLSELGKEAKDHGLRLSLHHHYGQPVMYRGDFFTFFEAVSDDAVGLTIDTAHLVKSGIYDIAGLIRELSGYIDNFHLKDYSHGKFRVLGEGDIDFIPVFEAIRDTGYDGWVSADEESGADVRLAMAQCHAFITKGLKSSET